MPRAGGGGGEAGLSRKEPTSVEACLSSLGNGPNETRFAGLVGLPVLIMLAVAAQGREGAVPHGRTDAVRQEPRRLVGDF